MRLGAKYLQCVAEERCQLLFQMRLSSGRLGHWMIGAWARSDALARASLVALNAAVSVQVSGWDLSLPECRECRGCIRSAQ